VDGVVFSVIGGVLIGIQGVLNSRISAKIGLWETTTITHVLGLVLTLLLLRLVGDGSFRRIGEVNPWYLMAGVFGAVIVFSVIKSISVLGPTLATAILLVTQLVVASAIDYFGLFGSEAVRFDFTKPLGIALMVVGIVIFKLRG